MAPIVTRNTIPWMNPARSLGVALLIALSAVALSGCGGDEDEDGAGGAAECHCDWGDSCDEYSSGCGLLECESNGGDAKAAGACSQEGVIGTCTCASEDLVTYYRSGTLNPQEECAFWCDDGVYTAR